MTIEETVLESPPLPVDPVEVLVVPAADYEKLKAEHVAEKAAHSETGDLLHQATAAMRAFIHQVDREGLGMQTVTDHRVRVDKFLETLKQLGRG